VVFLGDSLTAGLGLPSAQAYPSLIARRLAGRGWTVANAGVSGDTSAGALRRLEWSLDGGAAVLVVALGGNDALRGLPTDDLERNLDAIVTTAVDRGAVVVLAGMEAPPNNGSEYTDRFRQVYKDVAARHAVTLVPFLLDGVAGVESLNQADGIHPNQAGAERVADTVWRALEPVVREFERAQSE
jgi:acyl-CoA thioesterase-1